MHHFLTLSLISFLISIFFHLKIQDLSFRSLIYPSFCVQNIYDEYLIYLTNKPDLKLSYNFRISLGKNTNKETFWREVIKGKDNLSYFFPSLFKDFFRDSFQFKEREIILGMLKNYILVSRHFSKVFQRSACFSKAISTH